MTDIDMKAAALELAMPNHRLEEELLPFCEMLGPPSGFLLGGAK
jgi:hypothetical protein